MAERQVVTWNGIAKQFQAIQAGESYLLDADAHVTGILTVDGLINGRNLTNDGAKIDFLSVSALVDLDAIDTKVGYLTVSGAVDLDALNTRVASLDNSVTLMGSWNAAIGVFPNSTNSGESWICTNPGMVDGVQFNLNDRVIALAEGASNSVYDGQWLKQHYSNEVLSVAGKTGVVTLLEADISDLQGYLLPTDLDTITKLNLLIGDTVLTAGEIDTLAELNAIVGESIATTDQLIPSITDIAGTYTVLDTDHTVRVTSGTFDLTLLSAVGNTGRIFNLKNSGTGVVTLLTTAGQLIDAYASGDIVLYQYDNITVQSDGTNWIIL
jgi:hypothetical protein